LTDEQREAWKRAADERKRKEAEDRQSAIERLQRMTGKVEAYHRQVSQALDYWYSQGLNDSTINGYCLGYCPARPVEPETPSFVIPYFCQTKLIHIRHRLQFPNGHGKYRPEFAGLGNQLFNADTLTNDDFHFGLLEPNRVLIVEGEVKAMVLEQIGFKTIGIPGANSWRDEWSENLKGFKAYICLDPGANGQADKIGAALKGYNVPVKVVTLPCKPDDFFVRYGGTSSDLMEFLRQGSRI
jgi:hypothetical protein